MHGIRITKTISEQKPSHKSETEMLNQEAVWDIIDRHPALFGGLPDYVSRPFFNDAPPVVIDPGSGSGELQARGIRVIGTGGQENKVILGESFVAANLTIDFSDKSQSTVIIGCGYTVSGSIRLSGNNCLFSAAGFGSQGSQNPISVILVGDNDAVVFGRNFTSTDSQWILEGDSVYMVVGDDCMVSWQVVVRNYDSHAIFDIRRMEIINNWGNVQIGPHCWIGQGAYIAAGVTIGAGSIIGAKSVVTSDVPSLCVAAGVPARIIREGVSWHRYWRPNAEQLSQVYNGIKAYL